jgi:DICT domain-containing protein
MTPEGAMSVPASRMAMHTDHGLGIGEIAERTGVPAGTIRMWEQRYGFPQPERTPSGYRRYRAEDAETVRRVVQLREQGLSMPAAITRAQQREDLPTDRPSIFGAVVRGARPQAVTLLRKSTLVAISRAIEDEALARAAGPIVFGAFQREAFFRPVEHRWRRLAQASDAVVVFADFPAQRATPEGLTELPLDDEDAVSNEWAVIIDAPGYSACLLAWEPPGRRERGGADDLSRRFEAAWTLDPEITRQAAGVAARLAGRLDPALGTRLQGLLAERPLATERPAPGLTAVTNRMIGYLEDARLG